MNNKIEMIPAYRIAYIRKVGPYGAENVQVMEQLKEWAKRNDLWNDEGIILGIAQDNPAITKAEACRYDTCLVIENRNSVEHKDILQGAISGGKYVVFEVEHTEQGVQKAWAELFPELMKLQYVVDDKRPIIERYKAQMVKQHLCEICVPIC